MKVALMQPYFFPYLGYFQLINSVDEFVIFDNAQYIRRSWITRNRILNAHKESIYIKVPVSKAPRKTKIKDILINNDMNWKEKILHQLLYYKDAPNYPIVIKFVEECFTFDDYNLSSFNTLLLRKICNLFDIKTEISLLSERLPKIDEVEEADEWGIKVSKALNAKTYINAIGGKEFYNQQKYIDNGLTIQFINPKLDQYKQYKQLFVPGLSIIDVMMFNELDTIKKMINVNELVN
ncbi:WbqC family protein [Rummeliibacillus pycnus]|uniref:WbqC family protein n=1 Tax=Rummeliibacillus pycnus TaxID=101070 RepID=UPI003D29F885